MGTVYLAEHLHLGRLTAVKVICPPRCEGDAEAKRLFRREALLAARLSHPNVAHVFDFEHLTDGTYLLVGIRGGRHRGAAVEARGGVPCP